MRRAARVDENQPEIVKALRAVGATVEVTSAVGKGFPDLVVGLRGQTELMEIKNPLKPKADRVLTPDQVVWHRQWRGKPVCVVETVKDALAVFGLNLEPARATS